MQRGTVAIDLDTNTVLIKRPIRFAPRKPPDSSAEFEEAHLQQAEETVGDLATVLICYEEPMIVEGHTGGTNPPEYWQELADNRAKLICQTLGRKGVKLSLIQPLGVPGGGAKVVVYPVADEEEKKDEEARRGSIESQPDVA